VGESQLEARRIRLSQWHGETPERVPCTEMLDRTSLRKLLPGVHLGKEVSGASFGTTDGHVNPLRLLAALQKGLVHRGGTLLGNHAVKGVSALSQGRIALRRFDPEIFFKFQLCRMRTSRNAHLIEAFMHEARVVAQEVSNELLHGQ